MSKTTLIDTLERHGFSRAEADTVVSGLTTEAVEAVEPRTTKTLVGICGGMIATGLAVVGLTITLTTNMTGARVDAFAAGLRSEFAGLRESVAAQIAKDAADTQARFGQTDARFNQIDARLGSLENRVVAVDSKLDVRFGAIDNKIDRLTDALATIAKSAR